MNQYDKTETELITLTAFLIGFALIDHLDSNEQNSVGNFFMLIGQTLCTSGAETFRRDWNGITGAGSLPSSKYYTNNTSQSPHNSAKDLLNKTRNIFNQEIDKVK